MANNSKTTIQIKQTKMIKNIIIRMKGKKTFRDLK